MKKYLRKHLFFRRGRITMGEQYWRWPVRLVKKVLLDFSARLLSELQNQIM
jgi:hypothetical protein